MLVLDFCSYFLKNGQPLDIIGLERNCLGKFLPIFLGRKLETFENLAHLVNLTRILSRVACDQDEPVCRDESTDPVDPFCYFYDT